jgi:hypothetical protein
MKVTVSLTGSVTDRLATLATDHGAKVSTVVEAALERFFGLPVELQRKAIRETWSSKRATTPGGWMSTFWLVMSEEFGLPPPGQYAPTGPKFYEGFSVVFLLDTSQRPTDTLVVHAFGDPMQQLQSQRTMTKEYHQSFSAYTAARETADWIRSQQTSAREI